MTLPANPRNKIWKLIKRKRKFGGKKNIQMKNTLTFIFILSEKYSRRKWLECYLRRPKPRNRNRGMDLSKGWKSDETTKPNSSCCCCWKNFETKGSCSEVKLSINLLCEDCGCGREEKKERFWVFLLVLLPPKGSLRSHKLSLEREKPERFLVATDAVTRNENICESAAIIF